MKKEVESLCIMISINPPYARMINQGIKLTEFRKRIIKAVEPGVTVYIYETKNKGGYGAIVGKATIDMVLDLQTHSETKAKEIDAIMKQQFKNTLKHYGWVNKKNMFKRYLESIGYGGVHVN